MILSKIESNLYHPLHAQLKYFLFIQESLSQQEVIFLFIKSQHFLQTLCPS